MNQSSPNQEKNDPATESRQEDGPKFGRLLLILVATVGLIVLITFASEAYYS